MAWDLNTEWQEWYIPSLNCALGTQTPRKIFLVYKIPRSPCLIVKVADARWAVMGAFGSCSGRTTLLVSRSVALAHRWCTALPLVPSRSQTQVDGFAIHPSCKLNMSVCAHYQLGCDTYTATSVRCYTL